MSKLLTIIDKPTVKLYIVCITYKDENDDGKIHRTGTGRTNVESGIS